MPRSKPDPEGPRQPYASWRLEPADGMVRVQLDRPTVLNALNAQAWQKLGAIVEEIGRRPDWRVVVISGHPRAFAAGSDIRELATRDALGTLDACAPRVLRALEALPQPTVAAIAGYALGGGLELALACDLRIAAAGARLGLPEINLGILPGNGGTQRLIRLIGEAFAKWLTFTGEQIDAETSYRRAWSSGWFRNRNCRARGSRWRPCWVTSPGGPYAWPSWPSPTRGATGWNASPKAGCSTARKKPREWRLSSKSGHPAFPNRPPNPRPARFPENG